jgi:hypothetical protein
MTGKRGQHPTEINRYTVLSLTLKCWKRSCMQPGVNKGTFVQGRGYTSYHKEPWPVCMENHLRGCPHPMPEPDPENARCCSRPSYRRRGNAPVNWKTCENCGAHAPTKVVKELNDLPEMK